MRASRLPVLWFTAAFFVGGAGCGSPSPVGTGGSGGGGGATSSSTAAVTASATSTGSGGGAGGFGGAGGSATATGTGGAGGATSSSSASSSASSSGNGGAGGMPSVCANPSECPPPAGECITATCVAGVCGTANVAAGTLTMMQAPGDCLKNQCDGNGAIVSANDDTDPNDDSNPCTTDTCGAGVTKHTPVAAGITCGVGQVCSATGSCVGCVTAATCPGQDDECKARTCTANTCGFSFTAAGTPTTAQTAADCKKNQCDGAGAIVPVVDSSDLPVDNLQCTSDVCTAGVPSNPPVAGGTACSQNGGTTCNAGGQCVQCVTASTCPGQDTDCQARTCIAGTCGVAFTASGTPTPTGQTAGNCQKLTCNGTGTAVSVADNTDLPTDNNECTSDTCVAGAPTFTPTASGSTCTQGGTTCNGGGQCVQCVTASTCPGTDTQCQARTCIANACGLSFTAAGTPTTAQTAGDCKQNECNGAGAIVSANHTTDVPVDGNLCTSDVCTGGTPSNPATAAGSPCGTGGTLVCDGAGTCQGCNTGADCPGSDTDCHVRTCTSGTCGVFNTAAGNPTSTQAAGNCQINQCDGSGNAVNVADNADVPVDNQQCTSDVCTAGVPSNPALAAGTACTQNGGTTCNGSGACISSGATCSDGVKNGAETAIDCGGGTCAPCAVGATCSTNADCTSANCVGGTCFQNHLVINEIDYDQVGTDNAEFVEIYNGTGAAVPLAGYSIVLVNGANNATYLTVSLASATSLPAGGYLVVASSTVVVPATALKINFVAAQDSIQNGSPDGIALINTTTNTLVDALSYEGAMTTATVTGLTGTVSLVEGTVLPAATADSNTLPGSLARLPNGTDLNNAATDWAFTATATPGVANQ